MKRTWKLIKCAMNKSDNYKTIPEYFFHRDNRIDDRHDIADKFNKYFADIGNEISNGVPQSNYNFQNYLNRPNEHSMFMDPVTPIDVYTATSKIKTKTSKDHDGISTKLVKGSI